MVEEAPFILYSSCGVCLHFGQSQHLVNQNVPILQNPIANVAVLQYIVQNTVHKVLLIMLNKVCLHFGQFPAPRDSTFPTKSRGPFLEWWWTRLSDSLVETGDIITFFTSLSGQLLLRHNQCFFE